MIFPFSMTARIYYRTVGGGSGIERTLQEDAAILHNAEARQRWVGQRLQSVLRDAAKGTPFYRRLRQDGFDPETIRGAEDITVLPIVTRGMMQECPADFSASPRPPGSLRSQTGGSTGTPLTFWQDPGHRRRMRVDLYRGYRWCGYRPGDRMLFFWGSDYDSRAHQGILGRALDRFGYNRRWVNAFGSGPEELRRLVDLCQSWQPHFLIAYTTSAWLLARSAQTPRAAFASLRAVQVTAEVLTSTLRTGLESAFAAPVYNRYGCREVGNIAHECAAHAGLHVFEASHVVEVVDGEGRAVADGTPGRIVVTNLTNRATPFVRYDLGDIGRIERGACSCGRSAARLHIDEGRIGEIVSSPSGKWIHGEFFTHLFYKVNGVRRFRVVQEELRRLHILVESDAALDQQTLDFLRNAIRAGGDPEFQVTFESVDRISPSPSGKYRFVESRVPLQIPG